MVEICLITLAYLVITLWFFCCVMIVKNCVTYHNHRIISRAIYYYSIATIHEYFEAGKIDDVDYIVTYDDMEQYEKTIWRLWDWGYTRILPTEKFEIIKPYIEQTKEELKCSK